MGNCAPKGKRADKQLKLDVLVFEIANNRLIEHFGPNVLKSNMTVTQEYCDTYCAVKRTMRGQLSPEMLKPLQERLDVLFERLEASLLDVGGSDALEAFEQDEL